MVYDLRQTVRQYEAMGPLTKEDRERWGIPSYVRLEIPLGDPIWFRTVADRLRSLATELDLLSRTGDRPPHHIAWEADRLIKSANQLIKKPAKSGRSGQD